MSLFRQLPSEIVVHHSGEIDKPIFNWAGVRRYHMTPESQGGPKGGPWLAEGYHAGIELVENDYFAIFGRPWNWVGAHCPSHNSKALGLCFVGNYNLAPPPDGMLAKGVEVTRLWMSLYDIPTAQIYKHSDFNNTDCPGKLFPWDGFIRLCGGK